MIFKRISKLISWPLIVFGVFILFSGVTLASGNGPLISQVQITGGPNNTDKDFIELYNSSDSDIDLKGIRLVKRGKNSSSDTSLKSWTGSTIIKAHGYYLWANSSFSGVVADAAMSGTLANDNAIALRLGPNDSGAVLDSLAWGEANNGLGEGISFPANPGANQSLERRPGGVAGNGQDSDNNGNDFFLQTNPQPRNSSFPSRPAAASNPGPAISASSSFTPVAAQNSPSLSPSKTPSPSQSASPTATTPPPAINQNRNLPTNPPQTQIPSPIITATPKKIILNDKKAIQDSNNSKSNLAELSDLQENDAYDQSSGHKNLWLVLGLVGLGLAASYFVRNFRHGNG